MRTVDVVRRVFRVVNRPRVRLESLTYEEPEPGT